MGCSTTGIVAVLIMVAALIFSMVSFVAPNWSMSESPSDTLTNIKFSTGVWGYCVNAEYNTGANLSSKFVDTCFSFYAPGKISLNTSTTSLRQNNSISVCDAVRSLDESDLAPFVAVTGVNKDAFRAFLVLSCGSVGKSSFVFALLAVLFGTLGVLVSIVFVVCFPVKSCLVSFLKALTCGAALSSLIAFMCWLAQTASLGKAGIHPGSCFVIEIIACVSFLGAYAAINHHAASQSVGVKTV
ncbi:Aste57867_19289 [Aphanomyces stellatus]|uniref:Aste57867_19289 protein n=1 Tax=Aphanomyces stellatus TaxID=120398 RepID=A0A485LCD8_9STRA|nr:hypothetical protein As57867_019225 [Aphanomyces stellatus]VFT96009.1 Aste57867_19289 [Aphanomyces stellatus]